MKRKPQPRHLIVSLVLTSMLVCSLSFAQADILTRSEEALFQRGFSAQSLEERLERLETMIYGQAQSGDVSTRQSKLEKVLEENILTPVSAPQAAENPYPQQAGVGEASSMGMPQPEDATDYPTVTLMEQKIFSKSFATMGIAKRLAQLEKQVFQQTFDELPMVDRVDQLSLKVMPDGALGVEESSVMGLPSTGKELASTDLAVYSQLTTLEEHILGKSYGGELIAQRLNRLELKVFGSPKPGSVDNRMSALLSHISQQAKQQTQQMPQAFAGAPQVYSPSVPQPPQGLVNPSMPQQIGVGTTFGGHQFSQEFMNMLPPAIRQQMEARGSGSVVGVPNAGGGTIYQQEYQSFGPGGGMSYSQTYTLPNSMYITPGQVYRGGIAPYVPQQVQPRNPMNFPGGALGSLHNNMPQPQQQNLGMAQPMAPGGLTSNVHQSLVMLEYQVFGRTFDNYSIAARLNNLEQQVFGKTYPQYALPERINRLSRQAPFKQGMLPAQPQGGLTGMLGQALNMLMYNRARQSAGYDPYAYPLDPYSASPVQPLP